MHWFEPYIFSFLLCKTKTVKKVSITDEIIALLICVFVLPVFRGHRCLLSHLYEQKMVGRSSAPGKLCRQFKFHLHVDGWWLMRCWCWDLERHQCESWAWLQARRGPDRSKRSLPLPLITITINTVLTITITIIIITINHSYHYHYLPSPGHHQHRFASNTLCHLVLLFSVLK